MAIVIISEAHIMQPSNEARVMLLDLGYIIIIKITT
jgi:hypothetical protein